MHSSDLKDFALGGKFVQLLPAETRNASTIHDRGAGVAGVSMDLDC
jgi:hypothetical protein